MYEVEFDCAPEGLPATEAELDLQNPFIRTWIRVVELAISVALDCNQCSRDHVLLPR